MKQIPSQPYIVSGRWTSRPVMLTLLVFIALCLCTAFADFSTKGEPREALVALNMLNSGNWILPLDASGDMAFKPPMFHWLVALFSLPAGHVTEFSSRLPSVLALTLLLVITVRFCSSRRGIGFGLLCATFLLTCFEVLRGGTVARVDMVLTLFMVGAMYSLYLYSSRPHYRAGLLWAVACMSFGTLTKGPVAIILPVGIWGLWRLLEQENFVRVLLTGLLLLCTSLIIPLLWYVAAWHQGGERFLELALEENFGRFTGSMSYDSHVKPLWYNFTSLLTGVLPWSAALLFTLPLKRVRTQLKKLRHPAELWRQMSPVARFATVAALTVFVFYCIPKSKRSVYLLPMYPFIAYGLGCYAQMLTQSAVISFKSLRKVLISVICLLAVGFGIIFPIISRRDSDKLKAQSIAEIVPAETPVYTFIPDRFLRFYIIDFYLGGRLCSLLPSQQVNAQGKYDAQWLRVPSESVFYLLTTEDIATGKGELNFGLNEWLRSNGLNARTVYTSPTTAHDIKGHPTLLKIFRL